MTAATDSTKINRPGHNIGVQPTAHVQQNIFEKTPMKDGSSHLYASFDTFYVKLGQLFETQ